MSTGHSSPDFRNGNAYFLSLFPRSHAWIPANDAQLVLQPDSDFFKYFGNPANKEISTEEPKGTAPQPPSEPSGARGGG
jgi:hypothetical protein